jgi:hypothetical protein
MLWELGVLKEYWHNAIGSKLLDASIAQARKLGAQRLEAWTRDKQSKMFYKKYGFKKFYDYYQVVLIDTKKHLNKSGQYPMKIVNIFAHIDKDKINKARRFFTLKKIYLCSGFELNV